MKVEISGWMDLLFRKNGNVLIDAKLAKNFSKKVTVGEVGFERVDHLNCKTNTVRGYLK